MSVPEQVVVLLALTSGLFDRVPIDHTQEAEAVLLKSSTELSAEILKRLFSDTALSDSDREAMLTMAGKTLAAFQDTPKPDQNKQ